jgi:transcriptional regulator with XRE-family HTH domain
MLSPRSYREIASWSAPPPTALASSACVMLARTLWTRKVSMPDYLTAYMTDRQGVCARKFSGSNAQSLGMDAKRGGKRLSVIWRKRIGSAVRYWRDKRDLTQAELAEAVGVDPATIGKTELGKTVPDYATLESIADILTVSLDDLVGRNADWTKTPTVSAEDGTKSRSEAETLLAQGGLALAQALVDLRERVDRIEKPADRAPSEKRA